MALSIDDLALNELPRIKHKITRPVAIAEIKMLCGDHLPSEETQVVYCGGIIEEEGKHCLVYSDTKDDEDGVLKSPQVEPLGNFYSYKTIEKWPF